mgnify:CR=1 FL=1
MILTILSIENRIVKCKFDGNDAVLEIARRWFTEDIRDGDKTTITFTDPSITKDCFIDFYTDAYGVNPENVDYKEDGQVTLLFEEQEKDVRVRIKIREI